MPGARWNWPSVGSTSTTRTLKLPYQDNLSALIHEPTFKALAGEAVFSKARVITRSATRPSIASRRCSQSDALSGGARAVPRRLLARAHLRRGDRPAARSDVRSRALPSHRAGAQADAEQLQRLEASLRERDENWRRCLLTEPRSTRSCNACAPRWPRPSRRTRPARHARLLRSRRPATTSSTCCSRRPAGRSISRATASSKSTGCPTTEGKGFVDYVLWGDDGKPLGLVEAKRTRRDPRVGQQQAKLYADCLERQFGQRPIIFYSNGYEHWLWDDANYPPRAVQGFYKKAELELLIQRRASREVSGGGRQINAAIVERYYQTRAIRRIAEAFERDHDRKALLGHGHRRGQDAHRHRAGRSADALQLGQAGAVPGRPRGAGESGGERVQKAPAGCVAGESRHRERHRRPGLRLDLSDDDGADR